MRGPELKGRRADGLWENEFGLRGLIHCWEVGCVDTCLSCWSERARWELEDAEEVEPGFRKEGK